MQKVFSRAIAVALMFTSGSVCYAAFQNARTTDQDRQRVRQPLDDYLAKLRAQSPSIIPILGDDVDLLLPSYAVFAVRFRMFPVTVAPPDPLKSQNLFFVLRPGKPEGKLKSICQINTIKDLEAQLIARDAAATTEMEMKSAVRAWLKMSTELKQDGYFKFAISEEFLSVKRMPIETMAVGRATVVSGGTGEIRVAVVFAQNGKLKGIEEQSTVKPGIRPICQATKLLDRDPIVRRMAEQDLLVMGRAAKPYLDEQRARAGPKRRAAIARIWARIVEEGW